MARRYRKVGPIIDGDDGYEVAGAAEIYAKTEVQHIGADNQDFRADEVVFSQESLYSDLFVQAHPLMNVSYDKEYCNRQSIFFNDLLDGDIEIADVADIVGRQSFDNQDRIKGFHRALFYILNVEESNERLCNFVGVFYEMAQNQDENHKKAAAVILAGMPKRVLEGLSQRVVLKSVNLLDYRVENMENVEKILRAMMRDGVYGNGFFGAPLNVDHVAREERKVYLEDLDREEEGEARAAGASARSAISATSGEQSFVGEWLSRK